MDSMKISDSEISVNRILTDQRPLFMSSRSISGRPTVWRRITREHGAGGAMWLPLLPRLGGYARRCRWYRHGRCMRYAAGESHAANSYLCAQKSRVATTLSVLNVVPSCLAWWSRIPARRSRLARTTQLACGSLHNHTTTTFWPDNLALNADPRKLSQAQSTPFRECGRKSNPCDGSMSSHNVRPSAGIIPGMHNMCTYVPRLDHTVRSHTL